MAATSIEYNEQTLRELLASPQATEVAKMLLGGASKGALIEIKMADGSRLSIEGFLETLRVLNDRFGWNEFK